MKIFLAVLLTGIASVVFAQKLETVLQRGHELAVLDVAVSPDSGYIVTASRDKSARLWEISTRREVRSFLGHEASVTAVAFSSDGKLLATGSNDKHVKLWEVENGNEILDIVTIDHISSVVMDPGNRFLVYAGFNNTGSGDTAYVVDLKSRKSIAKIPTSPDKGLGTGVTLSVSADGKFLALGEDNRTTQIWETSTWRKVHQVDIPDGFCGGCGTFTAFSPNSQSLFIASHHGSLEQYALPEFKLVKKYKDSIDGLKGLAISADGKKVAIAGEEYAEVFDVIDGRSIASLKAREKADFHRIAFTLDGQMLLLACDDNTATVWDYNRSALDKPFTGFLNNVDKGGLDYDPNFYWQSHIAKYVRLKNQLIISTDGKTLIKGKFGAKVRRWDIATGKAVMDYVGHKKAVLAYDISKDGKKLLTGGGDGKIVLWDMESGDSLKVIRTYREPIFDIHFNNDETKVFTSSWDGTMKVHELGTGAMTTYIPLDNSSAYNILYHPNDLYLFTARLDNSLQMWETDTKSVVRNFIGHTDVISSLAITRDAKTLVSAAWDGTVRFWDIGNGLMTRKIVHGRLPVYKALFSPDERALFTAGADRLIKVWDTSTGKLIRTLDGHNAEITSLVFSPDNKLLISHSLDGVTKFWDLDSGKEFFEHIHLGDKEWLVKNKEGYFTGTDGARNYIHFVSGKKTFSVDQFFNDFYRPDLLPKMFQNRGADDSKGIQGRIDSSPPPVVKIAVLPLPQNRAEVHIRVQDTGSGVNNLRLMHNGKTIALDPSLLKYPSGKGEQSTCKFELDLIGGNNTFTAIASNRENVESDPRSVEIFTESVIKHSTCHILAVGINEYKNTKLNLNYAKPDAVSFSKIMDEQSSSLFKSIKVHTLFDHDATKDGILKKLDELSNEIHPEDVFVFYYAGHGSMVDNRFFFIPTENLRLYDQGGLRKDAIEASVVQEKLRNIKALKQLIIMDACQSGGSVELLATRGANEEKAIAQLSRSTGIHVLASAGSEQFAAEFRELGHGLFTYVLIKALEGEADGAPKDGKVTIYELKSYIDDQVPEMTRKLKGKPQYPYTFSRGQDFPVVIRR